VEQGEGSAGKHDSAEGGSGMLERRGGEGGEMIMIIGKIRAKNRAGTTTA